MNAPLNLRFATPAVALALGLALTATGALAQGGDDEAEAGEYPVTVNAGTCNEIGEVLYEVGTAEPRPAEEALGPDDELIDADEAADEAEPEVPLGVDVWTTRGEVETTFDELLGEQRVVAVAESEEEFDNYLACGQITGAGFEDDEDGQMVVGIQPLGGSGVSGFAVFEQDTQAINVFGEDVSGVTAYLFQNLRTLRGELEAGATPTP